MAVMGRNVFIGNMGSAYFGFVAVFEWFVVIGKFKNITTGTDGMVGFAGGVTFGATLNGFVEVFEQDNDN